MDISKELYKQSKEEYGEKYYSHMIEIYKLYVSMADNISARRQSANSFFLAVNTAIIGIVSYVQFGVEVGKSTGLYWLIGLAGMALCYSWYRLIKSYKDINSGKFKVVHEIERNLPISPYDAEWEFLGRGKDSNLYLPFTRVEMSVPWIFFTLHSIVFVVAFPWLSILCKVITCAS